MEDILKNQNFDVEIIETTIDGDGICKIDGFVIFVKEGVCEDFLNIKITKVLKSYGYARIDKIHKPSKYRINKDCKSFTYCGGCKFRHIEYDYELKIKKDHIENQLKKIAGVKMSVNSVLGGENVDGYRNKSQFPVGISKTGDVISGLYKVRSHEIIEEYNCKLVPNVFNKILFLIVEFCKKNNVHIYNEVTLKGIVRNVYIRYGEKTNQIMVCIVLVEKFENIEILVDQLCKEFKDIVSVFININKKNTNIILGDKFIKVYGEDYINDKICGIDIKLSPESFYQVNRGQAENLYNIIRNSGFIEKTDTVIDLYSGTGTIGLSVADKVKKVIGVEIVERSVLDAIENKKNNGIENIEFILGDVDEVLASIKKSGEDIEVILLDPPRKGCSLKCIKSILEILPKKIIMVSCNPSTASRDIKLLFDGGYELESVFPVDMFPRTKHVECVIFMRKLER